jgi:ABC-type uncharacterized transport system substrate-binding protein
VPKRLELLSELVPEARVIALLVNPRGPSSWLGDVQQAARTKGVQLPILKAATGSEIDAAFASLVELRARFSLGPTRSSTTSASSLWRWRHAMRFRRAMSAVSQWWPAA